MQVLSNGRFKAPLHRVLANERHERWSAPFFLNPAYDGEIRPVDGLGPRRYRPLSWAEFRARRFEGDFADYGSEVYAPLKACSFVCLFWSAPHVTNFR